jgi:hypothetical protein
VQKVCTPPLVCQGVLTYFGHLFTCCFLTDSYQKHNTKYRDYDATTSRIVSSNARSHLRASFHRMGS